METQKIRVLLAEDDRNLGNILKSYLEAKGYSTKLCSNGQEAFDMFVREKFDFCVLDVMMPVKDGFTVANEIRQHDKHIPILFLTAKSLEADKLKGFQAAADDYLTKPFDISLLIQKIRTIIRNREIVREKALKLIDKDTTEPLLTNEINDKFVKKLLAVAWENISNSGFDKDEFARTMNVSSSLLYKKVKSLTGQSPTDFIKSIRLRHASELLQSGKYTVTEVSEMCGFSSVGYFSTVFKGYFGKSPTGIFE